ncbi:hypothetical protein GPB2148_2249 [marine gamma proteobacterium HTCC2148]|jgi:hypothetical protein|nr:hypothetical protein GPB2148_2249 [marine gamma proteobacterium HTCC2148]
MSVFTNQTNGTCDMPELSLDVLTYTNTLESAGFNRTQAEAIARGTVQMQAQHFDTLVTREHFDHTMERIDQRFKGVDKRFEGIDKRLNALAGELAPMKIQLTLHTWMMGLIIIVLVVPQLQEWFAVG